MFFPFQTAYHREFQIIVAKNLPQALTYRLAHLRLIFSSFTWLKKLKACTTNSRDKLQFVYSTKSLIFDFTTILLPKSLILLYCFIAKVMHGQNSFTELKLSD